MAAAVSDYLPAFPQHGKLKKSDVGGKWSLELKENEDILSSINKEGIFTVGFKAEMDADTALQNAEAMLEKKGVDAVCFNLLRDSSDFGTAQNALEFITREGRVSLGREEKLPLSLKVLELCKSL